MKWEAVSNKFVNETVGLNSMSDKLFRFCLFRLSNGQRKILLAKLPYFNYGSSNLPASSDDVFYVCVTGSFQSRVVAKRALLTAYLLMSNIEERSCSLSWRIALNQKPAFSTTRYRLSYPDSIRANCVVLGTDFIPSDAIERLSKSPEDWEYFILSSGPGFGS